jgi:hypothetical protein
MRYFASRISDNIAKKPNGEIVCLGVPVARTGWQDYKGSELGLDTDDIVKVWRSPEEVFNPACIASFESATFTDSHPPEFVNPNNNGAYSRGHCQNVRRGEKELDGEEPLLTDIIIKDATTISKVNSGTREISCGYDCEYVPIGEGRYSQGKIRGNHIALVPSGRAGDKIRIQDSKEVIKMSKKDGTSWRNFLIGLGLKTYAKDAEPEELAKAAKAAKEEDDDDRHAKDDDDDDKKSKDKKVRDDDRKKTKDDDRHAKDDDDDDDDNKKKARDDKKLRDLICDCIKDVMSQATDADDPDKITEENKKKEDDDKKGKDADLVDPVEKLEASEIPKNPIPGADKALDFLRGIKPFVAKSKDAALIKNFNDAISALKGKRLGTGDGYAALLNLKKPDAIINAENNARAKATDAATVAAEYQKTMEKFHRKNIVEVLEKEKAVKDK